MNSTGNVIVGGRTTDMDAPYPDLASLIPLPVGGWHYVAVTQNITTDQTSHFIDGVDVGNNAVMPYADAAFPNTPSFSASLGSEDDDEVLATIELLQVLSDDLQRQVVFPLHR